MSRSGYVGRFAPSPTGRLHIGSLLAAVASWCDARHHDGKWYVRMEDLDPPREVPGAADDILKTLAAFGLHWDGPVVWQSQRDGMYRSALKSLLGSGHAFGCVCTRRMLAETSVYPGTCRLGLPEGKSARSHRFRMEDRLWSWNDQVQGQQHAQASQSGDFVVRRADGYWAYQLAVVVDDIDQGVNSIIRGADLLESTPGQMALREVLAPQEAVSRWGHLPLLVNERGQKLSKQTQAKPIQPSRASELLILVLDLLGQPVHRSGIDARTPVEEILNWASGHWDIRAISPKDRQWHGDGHSTRSPKGESE